MNVTVKLNPYILRSPKLLLLQHGSRRVVTGNTSKQKVLSLKLHKSTIGICQEGHPVLLQQRVHLGSECAVADMN